jgi:hypothetical protein
VKTQNTTTNKKTTPEKPADKSADKPTGAKGPPSPPKRGPVPPLFRRVDWLALLIAFAVVWTIYFLTLAPEQTLEDSGELCTGAFYAGIPHPPGYPFWTIYAWLWTKLLPIGNVAWRVEVGESTAAAMACALVAFIVSRGSSMLMEGIDELKELKGKWENAICLVSGVVAGLLLGFGGVMWSESVAINRISLFGVPWVMVLMLCLIRWIYAPHQRRYLCFAFVFLGICVTVHQTLLVAVLGIEAAVVYVQPRLGRHLLLWNSALYIAAMIAQTTGLITMLNTATMVLLIFHTVGVVSIVGYCLLAIKTNATLDDFCRDGALAAAVCLAAASPGGGLGITGYVLAAAAAGVFAWFAYQTIDRDLDWVLVLILGGLWVAGASFYFYEAIAGMTNPPMQWGYPRTVEGFFHALSRGQYEKANPSNVFADPGHFLLQIGMLISDIVTEYNWVCLFIALVPLLFFMKMQKRERAWILALVSVYFFIGGLLLILMNPQPDKQSADLTKVFFTSSHALIAIMIGYGFALTAAYLATHYHRFRKAAMMLGVVALVPALVSLYNGISDTFFGGVGFVPYDYVLILFVLLVTSLVLTALATQKLFQLSDPSPNAVAAREENRTFFIWFVAGTIVLLATSVGLVFLRKDSLSLHQLTGGLGRIFASEQYILPAVGGVLILGIVLGFIAALAGYRERAPLMISLGLFALMPVASGLSHWAESEQRNHWFGYWFGHDMFTPPVVGPDGKLTYSSEVRKQMAQGPSASLVYPEMDRNTILFGGTDPGRFNPTYMIFCDSFLPDSCKPKADPTYDRRDVYLITQNALADGTYLNYLRAQYYRSEQQDPPFFSELARYVLKDPEYRTNVLAKAVTPLDTFFEARGARIERRWRTSTSLFTDKDFLNLSAFTGKLSSGQDPVSKWLYQNLAKETQELVAGGKDENRVREALAKDLNALLERELNQKELLAQKQSEKAEVDEKVNFRGLEKFRPRQAELEKEIAAIKIDPLYDTNRFAKVAISDYLQKFIAQNPQSDTRIRLNRLLLEAAYPTEIAKSLGGVYPDREIYIPSPPDLSKAFQEYTQDAQRRFQHDAQFPNEPRQVRNGELIQPAADGMHVQVSGQISVMNINGLLTKVIFDHNPDNAFYVEESFPLDWMFPYLTPYGIIMKINRQPLPEITDEICRRDHEFWSKYSDRLIGNWITYDTSVKEITEFVERVYLGRNFKGFTGDRRFVRDSQAQKAFSKLRSSIAGIYCWRLGMPPAGGSTPPEYLPKSQPESARMIREADFALKQAFAFCPYSPEAVYRYVTLLLNTGRVQDALLVAETCYKLDPYNGQVKDLVTHLRGSVRKSATEPEQRQARR